MTKVAPFRAVRYNPAQAGDLEKVVAPPYDVISADELADLRNRSEYNVVHIDLPNLEGIADEGPYVEAGRRFREWIDKGILQVEERPALYLYHQRYRVPGTEQWKDLTGFIAAVRLARWDEGIVLPHEHTFSKPKEDRLRLMRTTQANLSQVYSFYSDPRMAAEGALTAVAETGRPDISVRDADGAEHNIWVVDSPGIIRRVVTALKSSRLYIADGHHRYETALNYRDEKRQKEGESERAGHEYVMMMIVNAEGGGLTVLPTHRMVRLAHDQLDRDSVRAQLAELFVMSVHPVADAAETARQATAGIAGQSAGIALVWPDEVWSLVPKDKTALIKLIDDEASDAWKSLGVTILHRIVLERGLQMERRLQDEGEHITYTRDATEAVQAVLDGQCDFACLVNAPSPAEIMEVAEAGDAMPHKSTYFYPKLLTGLVFNDLTLPIG